MELTAERVNKLFHKCLFDASEIGADGEPKPPAVTVEGITLTARLHKGRLEENKEEIAKLCDELPDAFRRDKGGGMSFLNMCQDKNGAQWTDLHKTMQELALLGMATGKMKALAPRDMWNMLPGGMPYFVVNV